MKLTILTFENDNTEPTLAHVFFGTKEQINATIASHRITDSFFNGSFNGKFFWKGGLIRLRNDYVEEP